MFALTVGTIINVLDIPPPPPGTPGPLAQPTLEALAARLEGGGFSTADVADIDVVFDCSSPEEFVTSLRQIAPAITALLEQYPPDVQNEAWAAITDAAREAATGDGPFGED